ncbi:hypothetical protein KKF61_07765 [Patescibacteria group bacterium]|nr:hypothetical protein [Patescibacteria group bacterium]
MAYSTCQRVATLIPNLLNGASSFDNLATNILPGSAALLNFMSSGCSLINTKLKSLGYAAPVGSGNDIYDYLADLEATYVAYRANALRASPRSAAGERSVADNFRYAFEDGLKSLATMDLSLLDIAYTGKWYVGGVSEAEKDSVASDSDRVDPRFYRGEFNNPNRGSTSACA